MEWIRSEGLMGRPRQTQGRRSLRRPVAPGFGRVKHLRVSRLREYHVARKANNPVTMVITSIRWLTFQGNSLSAGESERGYPI